MDSVKRPYAAPALTEFELSAEEWETAQTFFALDSEALEQRLSELEMADQYQLAGAARKILANRGTPNPLERQA